MDTFRLTAFRAADDPALSAFLSQKYASVLEQYEIHLPHDFVTHSYSCPNSYFVYACDTNTDEICGALRMFVSRNGEDLPLQFNLRSLDPAIDFFVDRKKQDGIAELSTFWVTRKGVGLSNALIRASVLLYSQLNIRSIITFCAPHTYEHVIELGFTPVHCLENGGAFFFPDERYLSRLVYLDTRNFRHASPAVKEVLENAETASAFSIQSGPAGASEVFFMPDLGPYHEASAHESSPLYSKAA